MLNALGPCHILIIASDRMQKSSRLCNFLDFQLEAGCIPSIMLLAITGVESPHEQSFSKILVRLSSLSIDSHI